MFAGNTLLNRFNRSRSQKKALMYEPSKGVAPLLFYSTVLILSSPFLMSAILFFSNFSLDRSLYKELWGIAFDSSFLAIGATLFSLILGFLFAYSLFTTPFIGKRFVSQSLNMTIILPVIVVVSALLLVYSPNSYISLGLQELLLHFNRFTGTQWALPRLIYNQIGVFIGFVFFNFPFVTAVFLLLLQNIPKNYWHTTTLYQFNFFQRCRYLIIPTLATEAIHLLFFVFLSCFTSFALLLILGGGKTTNLTTEIYFSLNENDLTRTVALCTIHVVLTSLIIGGLSLKRSSVYRSKVGCYEYPSAKRSGIAIALIFASILFIFFPILLMLMQFDRKLFRQLWLDPIFIHALWLTLKISFCVGFFTSCFAALLSIKETNMFSLFTSYLSFIFPSFVLLSGFLFIQVAGIELFKFRFLLSIFLVTMIVLPTVYRFSSRSFHHQFSQQKKVCDSLNIRGLSWFYFIFIPLSGPLLLRSFMFGFALAFGEFSIFSFLGDSEFKPISLLLYDYMGTYRFHLAEQLSIFLLFCYLLLFLLSTMFDRLFGQKSLQPSIAIEVT